MERGNIAIYHARPSTLAMLDRVPREELREVMHSYDAIKISQLMRRMLGGVA